MYLIGLFFKKIETTLLSEDELLTSNSRDQSLHQNISQAQ